MNSVRVSGSVSLSQRVATAIPDDKARAFVLWLVHCELDIPRSVSMFIATLHALFRASNKHFAITPE